MRKIMKKKKGFEEGENFKFAKVGQLDPNHNLVPLCKEET